MTTPATPLSDFLRSSVGAAPERDAVTTIPDWFAMRSHPGSVRAENQDRVASMRWSRQGTPCWAVAVADGIGGGQAGAQAASSALATFFEILVETRTPDLEGCLKEAAAAADRAVYRQWRGQEGTTLSAVVVTSAGAAQVNIGDSRIYGIDGQGEIRRLTSDDSLPSLPTLVQYVGIGQGMVAHTSIIPSCFTHVLLTTDGVHGYFNNDPPTPDGEYGRVDPVLRLIVREAYAHPRILVDRLTHLSLWCGGGDNATSALAVIHGGTQGLDAADGTLDLWVPGTHHRMVFGPTPAISKKARKPQSPAQKPAPAADVVPRRRTDTQPNTTVTMSFDDGSTSGSTADDQPERNK